MKEKKPSERIAEIFDALAMERGIWAGPELASKAIAQFLDEVFEAKSWTVK